VLAKVYERYGDVLYLVFRLLVGVIFFIYGVPKLTGWLAEWGPMPVGSLFWFAGLAEVLGGAAIALGVLTRLAALLAAIEMAVALFKYLLPAGIFPLRPESGEGVFVLIAAFLVMMVYGSGKWGLERLVMKKELF
jgi:putative oxidoreductase